MARTGDLANPKRELRMRVVTALVVLTAGCRLLRPIPENPETEPGAEPAAESRPPMDPAPASAGTVSAPLPERVGRLGDANIAAMLLSSNNTDISYARLVPSRALRDDVKQFAQRMLTDHLGVNALLNETLAKLDMAPEDNFASLDMRDESAEKRDIMREWEALACCYELVIEPEIFWRRGESPAGKTGDR